MAGQHRIERDHQFRCRGSEGDDGQADDKRRDAKPCGQPDSMFDKVMTAKQQKSDAANKQKEKGHEICSESHGQSRLAVMWRQGSGVPSRPVTLSVSISMVVKPAVARWLRISSAPK